MRRGWLSFALAVVACSALTTSARAQGSEADRALATDLFKRGRELAADGRYDEACPKLAESQRLDPGGGTLLNLALCHEAQGKTATAWSELNEAAAVAQRDGRADRERLALEHAARLEPRLSRLVIAVPSEARLADLKVRRDGDPVAPLVWGTPMPVDPGEHTIDARAAGRVGWSATVHVDADGDLRSVLVPVLPPSPPDARVPVHETPPPLRSAGDRPDPPPPPGRGQVRGGVTALALGGAALTAGAVMGVVALAKYGALDCPHDTCARTHADEVNLVNGLRGPSTGLIVVGAVGLATGAVLLLTARGARRAAAGGRLTPATLASFSF